MARIDTLRLLVIAELPDTLEGVEVSAREITARIDTLEPGTPLYEQTHRRLDDLLTLRERLAEDESEA